MPHTDTDPAAARSTFAERCVVLGGFAAAALCTIPALLHAGGLEAVAALWLARPSGRCSPRWRSRCGGDCATATGPPSGVASLQTATKTTGIGR